MRSIIMGIIGAACLVASLVANAAMTIRFGPGPDGTTRVSTAWGDYLIRYSGDSVWVGTEEEFLTQKATQIALSTGMMRFDIEGANGKEINFTSATLPHLTLGETRLASIQLSILFGVKASDEPKRPGKPRSAEYVQALWVQARNDQVSARLLFEDGKSLSPFACDNGGGFYSCEFIIEKSALTRPVTLVLVKRSIAPAVVPYASAAIASYVALLDAQKDNKRYNISPSDEAIHDLSELHVLDPNIPSTFDY